VAARILKKDSAMDLAKFARVLGYRSATDREYQRIARILSGMEMIEVQRSGFPSDSLHHHKCVVIRKPIELDYFKHVILTRTNYMIGNFAIHKATRKYKCEECREVINQGQRYGNKAEIGRKRKSGRRIIYDVHTLCLPCLIEKFGIEELM